MTQFLSTARLRFEDDGNPYSRVDKVALVATSEAARETLRVCFESQREDNCMHCAKCFRTAVALEALGGLERWPTFGGKPLSVERVRRTTIAHAIERYYWQELPAFCREHGREDHQHEQHQAPCCALQRARTDRDGAGSRVAGKDPVGGRFPVSVWPLRAARGGGACLGQSVGGRIRFRGDPRILASAGAS